jgi:GT2 family glycosyltransferase
MFSVIICSIDPNRFANVKAMYEGIFRGTAWELIHINDARSLAEGYNRGIARSKGDKLIFSHDDITVFSPDLPGRLEKHLSGFDIVGVAGTTLLQYPAWYHAGPPHIFGQVANPSPGDRLTVSIYGAPFPVIRDIQAIDGLFMAANRSIFPSISFDSALFDGFHLYDLDFSYSAFRAGLRIAVVNDICILHASGGNYDEVWKRYARKFLEKWFAGRPVLQSRAFRWAAFDVANVKEALEIMTPPYWRQISEKQVG